MTALQHLRAWWRAMGWPNGEDRFEVPATNDPMPYVWPEHLRKYPTGEPLRSMFSTGDGHALIFDPRPEFDAEVLADEVTREYTPPMSRLRDEYLAAISNRGYADLYAAEFDRSLAAELTKARAEERERIEFAMRAAFGRTLPRTAKVQAWLRAGGTS